jgi:hypothetical protein
MKAFLDEETRMMKDMVEKIKNSRTAASLLEYAQVTSGANTSLFLSKWADVIQPISSAKGGDNGTSGVRYLGE